MKGRDEISAVWTAFGGIGSCRRAQLIGARAPDDILVSEQSASDVGIIGGDDGLCAIAAQRDTYLTRRMIERHEECVQASDKEKKYFNDPHVFFFSLF